MVLSNHDDRRKLEEAERKREEAERKRKKEEDQALEDERLRLEEIEKEKVKKSTGYKQNNNSMHKIANLQSSG